jgi:hypothetical protein
MQQISYVWATAQGVTKEIVRWLEEREGKKFFARFKQPDLLRLTRLQVWSDRHHVSVYEILSLVLPCLRKTVATHTKKRYGLGVSIAALTGAGAEKILIEAIVQTYPEAEHISEWRERERLRQLEAEAKEERGGLVSRHRRGPMNVLDAETPQDFVKSYSKRVIAERKHIRAAYSDPKRKELKYRFSPWL